MNTPEQIAEALAEQIAALCAEQAGRLLGVTLRAPDDAAALCRALEAALDRHGRPDVQITVRLGSPVPMLASIHLGR